MSTLEKRNSALAVVPAQAIAAPDADYASNALSVQQLLGQVALIQQVMHKAMQLDVHYGPIPGCGDRPTLLKPGAEKLCLTFRLAPRYELDERQMDKSHREYRVQCSLNSILTGAFVGQGVGTCSTMEAKYRYRGTTSEPTDNPVPRAYWDVRGEDPAKAQELIGGKGFTVKKVDGKGWMIAKGGEKAENDNPADCYNTVLKMAKKRALVDAVLTATAASDIFTQDLEDITANLAATTPAAFGGGTQSGNASDAGSTTSRPVNSDANALRGSQSHVPTAAHPAPAKPPVIDVEAQPVDFRETRIHFGKNRGLMLSELTPQQVHWYESDWMPKKEVNGPASVEDLALIQALEAYRSWRAVPPGTRTVKVSDRAKAAPRPEEESQELIPLDTQLETAAAASRVVMSEIEGHLVANDGKGGLPKCAPDGLLWLSEEDKVRLMQKLPDVASKIIAARKKKAAQEAVAPKA